MSGFQKKSKKPAAYVICLFMVIISTWGVSCSSYSDTGTTGTTPPAGAAGTEVTMQGQAFRPATLTVTAGTMVTWRNNDGVTHTVTADDGSFDSGSLSGGDNFSHTFAVKGTFTYHCGFHPTMTGKVIVQ